MTPSREDLELYVTGNYEGDVGALERATVLRWGMVQASTE